MTLTRWRQWLWQRSRFVAAVWLIVAVVLWIQGPDQANAGLVLTPAGVAQGFSLSTFASGFPTLDSGVPGHGYGPFGIGFPAGGSVLVLDAFGDMRRFPTDTDGQN